MKLLRWLFIFVILCVTAGLFSFIPAGEEISISSLHYIGSYELPHKKMLDGTTIGGLSGIDYDASHDVYYLISDDRSAITPARFYTAKIHITSKGIDSVEFLSVRSMRQANGAVYPSFKEDPWRTPDPEAIRYNPVTGQLAWTSEGERIIKDRTILQHPSINLITTDGKYADSVPGPSNARMHAIEKGARQNGGFEGLTFTRDYKSLITNVEIPLYEDGPEPNVTETKSWIRLYQFDVATKKNTAQYAYRLESIAYPPNPATGFRINGVADILSIANGKLLVLERSFSTGRLACTIKIFLTDLRKAVNVQDVVSLTDNPPIHPAEKKLLLDMDKLGMYTDNVEGMTFGPDLPNGHHTLLLAADDNFQVFEKTQFFLFEVMP